MELKLVSTYEYIVEKSRFIGFYYEVDKKEQIQIIFEKLKSEHKKARHVCYGYKIINDNSFLIKGFDDGEPKGTASIPIINAIQNSKNNNFAIFIVRYFGGIKLGKGGLYRSYSKTALELLKLIS